jgi:hypothetical protein
MHVLQRHHIISWATCESPVFSDTENCRIPPTELKGVTTHGPQLRSRDNGLCI